MKAFRVLIAAVALLSVMSMYPSDATSSSPAVTLDLRGFAAATAPDGQVWLVWAADDGHDSELFYSRWNGENWSSPRGVGARPDTWESSPSLTFSADGTAWLGWTSADQETSGIYISRWAGYRWSEPQTVPLGRAAEAKEPALAAGPDGTIWLAWVGFDGTDDEVFVSHRDGRSWSAPWQVSADDGDASLYDRQPRLAVGRDGKPWVVWTGHQAGVDDEIYASRWTGTRWTPEQAISGDDDMLDVSPALALDAQGQPWVAWKGRMTDEEQSRLRILVSHWDASHSTWTPEAVASSPLASAVDEELPVLSPDRKGGMRLAWRATGDMDSALAHARWEGSQWTEPRLVRTGVNAEPMVLITPGDNVLRLLWLDPALDDQLPLEWVPVEDTTEPLSDWIEAQVSSEQRLTADPVSNRFLAFGDSITLGDYPKIWPAEDRFQPYPATLEDTLDTRVMAAEMINEGQDGEATGAGKDRIKDVVSYWTPQYVMIMEGTNDVSHNNPPSEVLDNLLIMLDNAKKHAGVTHIKVMLATIIPRLDDQNDETAEVNQEAIAVAADLKKVPLCDPWQAFVNYGDYAQMYWDNKHPNQTGLDLLAQTFYGCLLGFYTWLAEETTPPTTWIDPLPPQSECGIVHVSWGGEDNLSWVVDYDVQIKVNAAPWTDWFVHTQNTSGTYTSDSFGDIIGFQVRGRDVVGNQSTWSAAEDTQIADSVPPYEAHVRPLPPVQLAPFPVSWWGADACADVVAYRVQYSAGTPYTWLDWPGHPTPNTSGSFAPPTPQYGQTYYFRVQAQDEALNWSAWSNPLEAHTLLAQFSLQGHSYNLRHQPVAQAQVQITPSPTWLGALPGGFLAYIATGANYDITASRNDLYGPLPTRFDVAVNGHVSGLEFILPPQDDAVTDGDFEAGHLAAWQVGGSTMPTLTNGAHTGQGAVRLDGTAGDSRLSQAITPALAISEPSLSFLVRLEVAGPASTLQVELGNTGTLSPPVTYTLAVEDVAWTHFWRDLTGLVSEPLTLTFVVPGGQAIILDEVRLGSALTGGQWVYLPLVSRGQ